MQPYGGEVHTVLDAQIVIVTASLALPQLAGTLLAQPLLLAQLYLRLTAFT